MVQAGTSIGYDGNMEESPETEPAQNSQIRAAVREVAASIRESSKQLASAAEKFADESVHILDAVAANVQSSLRKSTDMAAASSQAAAEARQIAQSVHAAAFQAGEHAKTEARQAAESVVARAEQAYHAAEQIKAELEQRLEAALQRIEASSQAGREVEATAQRVTASATAAEESLRAAREAASRAEQAASLNEDLRSAAEQRSQEASQRAETALASSQTLFESAQQAATEARQAAADARDHADRAEQFPEPAISTSAQQVLERLEADYQLLTRLVQELHARISGLPAPAMAASKMPSSHEYAPPAPLPDEKTQPDEPEPFGGNQRQEHAATPEAGQASADTPEAWLPQPPASPNEPTSLAGRIVVRLTPVPDFDHLLSLDGALGRMNNVLNVTLADYAQDEVTFRVELEAPMPVSGLAQGLADAAGRHIEVVNAQNETLRLVT